jgi:hypothetical protein
MLGAQSKFQSKHIPEPNFILDFVPDNSHIHSMILRIFLLFLVH